MPLLTMLHHGRIECWNNPWFRQPAAYMPWPEELVAVRAANPFPLFAIVRLIYPLVHLHAQWPCHLP